MAGAVSKARTPIKRIQFALMGALIGLVIGIVGVFAVQNLGSSNDEPHVEPSVVFDRIVAKSELVSASQQYNITDKSTQPAATFFDLFDIPFTDTSFWYRYVGTIKAGVDLDQAEFSQEGDIIRITLNQPYIISNTPNMEESGVIEENNNLFAKIPLSEVDEFQRQCIEKSESGAIEGELMDEARANAEQDIADMFNAALGNAYTVEFEWREAS